MRRTCLLLLPLLLPACTPEEDKGASTVEPEPEVGWYKDIAPMIARNCASCHDGAGVGGVDLTDPAIAVEMANTIAAYVSSGLMPPPAADPSCRSYAGADRMTLSDADRALFSTWAEAGAPLGSPESAPVEISWESHIESPDLVLTMPFAHTLSTDLDGNEYFCVELDNPLTETAYVTGLDVSLGTASVVHHLLLIKDLTGDAGIEYGTDEPKAGFDCRDPMMEDDWLPLHAWAPGMGVTEMASGTALRIDPGEQLILQMHYFAPGDTGDTTDQSSYLLRLSDEPDLTAVELAPIGPEGFRIPAGESAHTETDDFNNRYADFTVYGVFPHMHLLGTSYHAWIEDEAGNQTCIAEGDYDFDHQAFYMYDEPLSWPQGDSFWGSCTWDNSAANPNQFFDPPETVRYGEGTTEEMCYFLMYFSY